MCIYNILITVELSNKPRNIFEKNYVRPLKNDPPNEKESSKSSPNWLITFGLSCLLSGAICCGLVVAIMAGIAYGYNYCMAEWITFTRSDVTVYMRRGQFYDGPISPPFNRRSNVDAAGDQFGIANRSLDYDDRSQGKPLSDTWMKSQDTRRYAEKLTKYSPPKPVEGPPGLRQDPIIPKPNEEISYHKIPETNLISILPHALMPTESWRSGSSEIVMRNFKPMQELNPGGAKAPEDLFPTSAEQAVKPIEFADHKFKELVSTVNPLLASDKVLQSHASMRTWTTAGRNAVPEYVTEDIDEDNIVYKPV